MSVEFSMFQSAVSSQNKNNGVFARFYDRYVKTGNILKNGLPEFQSKLYVEIKVKDQYDVFDQPAEKKHIERFFEAYQKYKEQKKEIQNGTPLSMFAFLDKAEIESCEFRGIYTVEKLAGLSDETAQELGLEKEKKLALKFLKASKNNEAVFKADQKEDFYLSEIQKLKEQISELKQNAVQM